MDPEEKENMRSQVSETTAEGLMEWLQGRLVGFPQIMLNDVMVICCTAFVKVIGCTTVLL